MTKVDFYTGVEDKLRTACKLCHKVMQHGLRVVLHAPDEVTADTLDRLLWQYPAIAFVPHCRNDGEASGDMPVVIAHDDQDFSHHEVLISLHTACLPFFSRFERVIEIVSQNEQDARLGRERFSFYRDRGYEMRHFNLAASASG